MKILDINNLTIKSKLENKNIIDKINFSLEKSKITCIVGESGSGKTITSRSIIKMLPKDIEISSGNIMFKGENLLILSEERIRKIRGKEIFTIFQNSINCFNPSLTMENQIYNMISSHFSVDKGCIRKKLIDIMGKINLNNPESILKQYPFQLSGGMLQRMMIAVSILIKPDLLIADEPTTALDLKSQKEILKQFKIINEKFKTTILMITHDFAVVDEIAEDVIVMKNGKLIEKGKKEKIFNNPQEEYTKKLMKATFKREVISTC